MTDSPSAKTEHNAAVVAAREAGAKFTEIGVRFGISPERARQIFNLAMLRAKLRQAA
jgi:DNA-directed RNA polymerase sigma subunit (sigma70/sigma32)